MIFLYYGPNTYSLFKKKQRIKTAAQKQGASLSFFDSSNLPPPSNISQLLSARDLFVSQKIIIFSDVLTALNSLNQKSIQNIFKTNPGLEENPEILIYFFDVKPQKNSTLFRLIKKTARRSTEYPLPKNHEFVTFLEKQAHKLKLHIQRSQLNQLSFLVNFQIWPAMNELYKLKNYKKNQLVTTQDLEQITSFALAGDIFKTIDALGRGDKKTALSLAHRHLRFGDDPFYIFAMVVFQFRNLLKIKSAQEKGIPLPQIPQKTSLHPFVVKKASQFLGRFTLKKLKILYQKLAQIDQSTKSGATEIDTALDLFIIFS